MESAAAPRLHAEDHVDVFELGIVSIADEARVSNRATGTTNVHRYEAQVDAPLELTVPAGRFRVWPVRYVAQVTTVDDEIDRRWRNEETLAWSPEARLFVRAGHRIVGPDGRPTRDSVAELLEARRAG